MWLKLGEQGHGASGTTSHRMMYGKKPGKPPGNNRITKTMRGMTGSMLKYSAKPPQTPAILRSVRERYSRLGGMSLLSHTAPAAASKNLKFRVDRSTVWYPSDQDFAGF